MRRTAIRSLSLLCSVAAALSAALPAQERLPGQLAGTWTITRVLAFAQGACYTRKDVQGLLGSRLLYTRNALHWKGGSVPLTGIVTHRVNSNDLKAESAVTGTGQAPELSALGIDRSSVLEINLQHGDADITGTTTEVPGDTVLLAAPGQIVVSACGVYMEARRPGNERLKQKSLQ